MNTMDYFIILMIVVGVGSYVGLFVYFAIFARDLFEDQAARHREQRNYWNWLNK